MKRHPFTLNGSARPWRFRPFSRRWLRDKVLAEWARPEVWQSPGRCEECGLDFEAVIHRPGRVR